MYYQELPTLLLAQLQREHARAIRQQRELQHQAHALALARQQLELSQLARELQAVRTQLANHH